MNILIKKLKKVNLVKKIFYFATLILYIASYIFFMYGLLKLAKIETLIRIIILVFFGIWFLVYFLAGLLNLLSKKKAKFIVLTTITLIFCPIFFATSYFINKGIGFLNQTQRTEIEYKSNLIALKETNFTSSSVIGMIETESDIPGNQLAKKLIKDKNLSNKVETFEDYNTMIRALYKGDIDACFVSGDYAIIFKNEVFEDVAEGETPPSIGERVKVLFEYSEVMQNQDLQTLEASKTKEITEPFTVLIMGVDSENDGLTANQAFNGDTLILVTFNPNTLTTTMFSIPRDLYVPISCNHNRYNKINSSAAYGSSCVIGTVEQLTGINIDFYVKINFKGVVDLVDILGGVTVDVEVPDFNWNAGINCNGKFCEQNSNREFGDKMIYLDPGVQTLNGEEALAYARCRHLYALSDIARNKHQQEIIEAMVQKMKQIKNYSDFENILKTVSRNIETNMTTEQILSFYNVGKSIIFNSDPDKEIALSIKKTQLTYYNLTVWRGYDASSLGYYKTSLDAITKLMRQNLELEKTVPVKTFSISYNEDYKTPLVGEGLYGGEKLETLPNFFGYDRSYIEEWCDNHDLSYTFENINDPAPSGTIVDQSVHEHSLVKAINETITFYVSNGQGGTGSTEENQDDNNNNNDNNNDNKDDNNNDNNDNKDNDNKDNDNDNNNNDDNSNDNNDENNDEE